MFVIFHPRLPQKQYRIISRLHFVKLQNSSEHEIAGASQFPALRYVRKFFLHSHNPKFPHSHEVRRYTINEAILEVKQIGGITF